MASLGGEQLISTNSQSESAPKGESRESSVEKKASMERSNSTSLHWFAQVGEDDSSANQQVVRDRDEKLKLARERQNEERQKKIEELKAQAEAAQKYREQKEEERRRRIEQLRHRDCEKRQQVEERKRAINEAEKERREYILRKNQERESRLETKRRERSSIGFAFGSSTPRLLEPADFGTVSPSNFWGHRRSTSISNVAGASLSRRSSERELADSGSKKRATSASGADRHDDHRRKSSSMYEVFNWGYSNDEPPKRFSLSIVGSEINIDEPTRSSTTSHRQYSKHFSTSSYTNEDNVDTSQYVYRSVARRKTDLMPTIPSPRDTHYGSRSSLSTTPKTPGRAFSMNRLDQLAQPIRRNGEHIRAVIERERQQQLEMLDETESLGGGGVRRTKKRFSANSSANRNPMSRSMTHLATMTTSSSGSGAHKSKYSMKISSDNVIASTFHPLGGNSKNACKSMSQLAAPSRMTSTLSTAATKKYLSSVRYSATNTSSLSTRYERNSLLMSTSLVTTGSRSGDVTPGGSINTSRPGSAMSTSTTMSTSGYVHRRSAPPLRKPRPASIAGTGVSLDEINKLKRENKPPVKTSTSIGSNTQTTPKRTSNIMSTSLTSSRVSSVERKTPLKKDSIQSKVQTPKSISKTSSSEKLKDKSKEPVESLNKSITQPNAAVDEKINAKTKDEKNALNTVKTETETTDHILPSSENGAISPVSVAAISEQGQRQQQQSETVVSSSEFQEKEISDEKTDQGNEKDAFAAKSASAASVLTVKKDRNNGKENSLVRDLSVERQQPLPLADNEMTASMIAKSKITTEEEAKAALAERRRLAREEAERQAELERQRIEAERLAEIKRQEEEAERQRMFEEEALHMAQQQRKAEEERLRQAIEEASKREEEERQRREEEEKQKVEREEAEKKAKEEAEKQRIEVAERLKREEKEREERRKRVEAIMSRTRKAGSANTPNSTPVKDSDNSKKADQVAAIVPPEQQILNTTSNNENSSGGSSGETTTTPTTTTLTEAPSESMPTNDTANNTVEVVSSHTSIDTVLEDEPQNSQAMYEQSVTDKESALMKSFSAMIIDENAKNLQNALHDQHHHHQQQQHQQQPQIVEVTNGKMIDFPNNDIVLLHNTVANGNGHIGNINNKNDINILQDVPSTNQLIDLSIESQDINNAVNFNNNNSLLATTTSLVTADSHENKDISLL